jgi:hypothetical protein
MINAISAFFITSLLKKAANRRTEQFSGEQNQDTTLARFKTTREKSCGGSEVDVRDQQALFSVWLVAKQSAVRPRHCRSCRRPGARAIYTREIAGILGGAAQDCLLVK